MEDLDPSPGLPAPHVIEKNPCSGNWTQIGERTFHIGEIRGIPTKCQDSRQQWEEDATKIIGGFVFFKKPQKISQ